MTNLFLFIIIALISWGIFFPSSAYLSTEFLIKSTAFVLLLYSVGIKILNREYFFIQKRIASYISFGFLVFLLSSIVSVYYSVYEDKSFELFSILATGFFLYYLIGEDYSIDKYKITAFFLIVIACLQAVYGIYQFLYGFERNLKKILADPTLVEPYYFEGLIHAFRTRRIFGSFGNPNLYALFLAMCSPAAFIFFFYSHSLYKKIILSFSILLILVSVLLSASKAGLLQISTGLLLSIIFLNLAGRKIKRKFYLWLLGLLILGIALSFVFIKTARKQNTAIQNFANRIVSSVSTAKERVNYYKVAWAIFKNEQYKLLGAGLGSYAILFSKYKPLDSGESKYVHNLFLQILVEQGIIGLLISIFFFATAVIVGERRILNRQQQEKNMNVFLLVYYISIIIFLMDGLTGYGFYYPELYYLFCILLGLIHKDYETTGLIHDSKKIMFQHSKIKKIGIIICVIVVTIIIWYCMIFSSYLGKIYFYNARHYLLAVSEGTKDSRKYHLVKLALDSYKKALLFSPNNSEYHQHLGNTFILVGDYQQGIYHLKKATELNPYTAYYYSDLADAYIKTGDFISAEKEIKKAVQNYPTKPKYRYQLAFIYNMLGKCEQAQIEINIAKGLERKRK